MRPGAPSWSSTAIATIALLRAPPALARARAAGLLTGALAAPAADARRKPRKRERTAILGELHERAGCFAYPAGTCHEVVRVATARKGWSPVYIRPTRGNENAVKSDAASLKRRNGRWRIHQLGNGRRLRRTGARGARPAARLLLSWHVRTGRDQASTGAR